MPEDTIKFKHGDQIAYIPTHANGEITHPDVEFGFVTSETLDGGDYFCRYWRKGHPGQLRTVSNSERTPGDRLRKWTSVIQQVVDEVMASIYGPNDENNS
jgi:hypothetical protein